jgi:hypothetical protein
VTDGNRLYFTENPPARYAIAQVAAGGGETAPIDVPFPNPIVGDVSPERSELLLLQGSSGETPYWSMPVPAGSPRRLGDLTGRDAAWAPNGKLVFAKGNDVYIAEHDGIQTTERYLGCKQRIQGAVNDKIGIEPSR